MRMHGNILVVEDEEALRMMVGDRLHVNSSRRRAIRRSAASSFSQSVFRREQFDFGQLAHRAV
jgi:hypothetical protein